MPREKHLTVDVINLGVLRIVCLTCQAAETVPVIPHYRPPARCPNHSCAATWFVPKTPATRAPTLCDAAGRAARTEARGVCQRPVRDPGLNLDCPSLHRAGAVNGSRQGEVLNFRGSGIICILRLARWTGWTW